MPGLKGLAQFRLDRSHRFLFLTFFTHVDPQASRAVSGLVRFLTTQRNIRISRLPTFRPMPIYGQIEKRRGKPKATPARRLAARIWVHALFLATGIQSFDFASLERRLGLIKRRDGKLMRLRYVDRCWEGGMTLDGGADPHTLANRIEVNTPGTARWVRSPLWTVLDGTSIDTAQITQWMRSLEPEVASRLVTDDLKANRWRERLPFIAETSSKLLEVGSFDALVAAVLLVRESEVIASAELRNLAIALYHGLQPKVARIRELEPFYPELFGTIDGVCKAWVFPHPNQRLDIHIFWEGVRDNVWGTPEGSRKRRSRKTTGRRRKLKKRTAPSTKKKRKR